MDPPPGSVSRAQVEEDFAKLRARMQLLNDEFQRLEERNQCVMEHVRYLRVNRLKVVAAVIIIKATSSCLRLPPCKPLFSSPSVVVSFLSAVPCRRGKHFPNDRSPGTAKLIRYGHYSFVATTANKPSSFKLCHSQNVSSDASSKYYTLLVSLAITVTAKETIDTLHTLSPPLQGLGPEQAVKED
ncbi:unnamed protein product [Sphagnum balticum]